MVRFTALIALALGACQGFSLYSEDAKGVPVEEYENIDRPAKVKLEGRMLVSANQLDYVHLDTNCRIHQKALKATPKLAPTRFWIRNGRIVDASGADFDRLALCSCCKK